MKSVWLLTWILFSLITASVMASTADAAEEFLSTNLQVDRNEVQVAEPVRVVLSATAPDGWNIQLPDVRTGFGELKVIDSVRRRESDSGTFTLSLHLTLESLLPGRYRVGPLDVQFTQDNGASGPEDRAETIQRSTRPITVRVRSAVGVFERRQLREIYGPVRVPWSWRQWAAAAAVMAGVLAIALSLYRWIDRWRTSGQLSQRTLLRRLDQLDEARLNRTVSNEQLILALADVVRQSLQLAEGGDPVYRTTDEWNHHLHASQPPSATSLSTKPTYLADSVDFVLREADAIKFAEKGSTMEQVRRCLDAARKVVRSFLGEEPSEAGGGSRS